MYLDIIRSRNSAVCLSNVCNAKSKLFIKYSTGVFHEYQFVCNQLIEHDVDECKFLIDSARKTSKYGISHSSQLMSDQPSLYHFDFVLQTI